MRWSSAVLPVHTLVNFSKGKKAEFSEMIDTNDPPLSLYLDFQVGTSQNKCCSVKKKSRKMFFFFDSINVHLGVQNPYNWPGGMVKHRTPVSSRTGCDVIVEHSYY